MKKHKKCVTDQILYILLPTYHTLLFLKKNKNRQMAFSCAPYAFFLPIYVYSLRFALFTFLDQNLLNQKYCLRIYKVMHDILQQLPDINLDV